MAEAVFSGSLKTRYDAPMLNLFSDTALLLGGLWLSAFTSATILPGTSDAAFAALVHNRPELAAAAWLTASCANSLGSLTSYWLGRLLPPRQSLSPKTAALLQRYGAWALLLAWLPLVGDALPAAAGWLRLNAWTCAVAITVGKTARYGLLWWAVAAF